MSSVNSSIDDTTNDSTERSGETRQMSVWRVAWIAAMHEPKSFIGGTTLFWVFFLVPALTGWSMSRGFGAIVDGRTSTALWWALVLAVGEVVRMAALYVGELMFSESWVRIETLLRSNMLAAQLASGGPESGAPVSSSGEAMTNFRDDVHDTAMFIDIGITTSGAALVMFVMGAALGLADPTGALVLAVPTAVVTASTFVFMRLLKAYRRADREAAAAVSSIIGDTMAAATTIKVNDAIGSIVAELDRRSGRRLRTAVRDRVLVEAVYRFGNGAVDIGLGAVIIVSAGALASGRFDVAGLALFISYSSYLAFFPRMLGRLLATSRQIEVTYDRMSALVADERYANLVVERRLPIGDEPRAEFVDRRPPRVPLEQLSVEHLSIAYDGITVLNDATFTVDRGDIVVITGPIGSGKSSLLRAVLGVRGAATVSGNVRWNGDVLRDRAAFLVPPNAAYLPQVPQLVSDSVAENVALGAVDHAAVTRAIATAELTSDIETMPDGLDTLIGPRGLRLSGGQRQRLASARAIATSPELVVLDDLSSAVDVETELRLWQRFADAGLTVLAVSHRPLAFERATAVYRVADGRMQQLRHPRPPSV